MHDEELPVDSFTERHYTVAEIAEMWQLSLDKVRRIFQNEVGVLILQSPGRRKNVRPYKTLRIPASVAVRVYQSQIAKTTVLNPTCGVRPAAVLQRVDRKHSIEAEHGD